MRENGLEFPVMMDNEYAYWKKLGNRYWPTFYVTDKRGRIVGKIHGETHAGTDKARKAEAAIEKLLAEK